MKTLLRYILDINAVLYICLSLVFVVMVGLLFWDVEITKGSYSLIAILIIISWAIMFISTISDYLLNDMKVEQRELWLNVFKWGICFMGLGLGVIVYYLCVFRRRLHNQAYYKEIKYHERNISYFAIVLGYKVGQKLFYSLFICVAAILLGFIFKYDLLFSWAMKITSLLFVANIIIGIQFQFAMLTDLVEKQWANDEYKIYLTGTRGLYMYFEEVYDNMGGRYV